MQAAWLGAGSACAAQWEGCAVTGTPSMAAQALQAMLAASWGLAASPLAPGVFVGETRPTVKSPRCIWGDAIPLHLCSGHTKARLWGGLGVQKHLYNQRSSLENKPVSCSVASGLKQPVASRHFNVGELVAGC